MLPPGAEGERPGRKGMAGLTSKHHRRGFLKGAAMAGLGLVAACAPAPAVPTAQPAAGASAAAPAAAAPKEASVQVAAPGAVKVVVASTNPQYLKDLGYAAM